jgi:hypothetical protein
LRINIILQYLFATYNGLIYGSLEIVAQTNGCATAFAVLLRSSPMPRRSVLSLAERENLLALPGTQDELIRH